MWCPVVSAEPYVFFVSLYRTYIVEGKIVRTLEHILVLGNTDMTIDQFRVRLATSQTPIVNSQVVCKWE